MENIKSLDEIIELVKLKKDIDFIGLQIINKSDCGVQLEYDKIKLLAKKYNLKIDSKILEFISVILKDNE